MYRGLILVVTISLASIALADVLVQPGYEHQYGNNPQYQTVPQYRMQYPTIQYHAQQLPNQESTSNLAQAQTSYYKQDKGRSHGIRYLHRINPYHHQFSKPNRIHYSKIGGHGYTRPSVFVGYHQPQHLIVHHWPNRSRRSVPTSSSQDSSKSAIVTHDNDVAAKSPLTDAKADPTAIDSLLPEHEPTDTNNKRVENRQSKNDHVTGPLLLGLYPEKMHPRQNTMQYMKSLFNNPSMLTHSASATCDKSKQTESHINYGDSHIISNRPNIRMEPTWDSDEEEDEPPTGFIIDRYYDSSKYPDASYRQSFIEQLTKVMSGPLAHSWPGYYSIYYTPSKPRLSRPYEPHGSHGPYNPEYQVVLVKDNKHQPRTAYQELGKKSLQEITNMDMIDTAEPRQDKFKLKIPYLNYSEKSPVTTDALVTTSVQPQYQQSFAAPITQYKSNEELSGTDDMSGTPYFNKIDMPYMPVSFYTDNYPNFYSNYNLDNSNERAYLNNENIYNDFIKRNSNSADHIKPSINQVPDYVLYKNISARNNLEPTIPQMQTQFLDTYNYSPENNYAINMQAIPQDYKYYSTK